VYDYTEEVREMTVGDVVSQAIFCASGANLVVLSGGEPLAQVPVPLQDPGIKLEESYGDPVGLLVNTLLEAGIETHIETAGVRRPSPFLHEAVGGYVVSPKLVTSGNSLKVRRDLDVLRFFADTNKAFFKFVITEPNDFSEISQIAALCSIPPWRIWVMPEGTTPKAIQEKMTFVADRGIRAGYNVSSRLHILAWGDQRAH
jgi:organic radical activating enzyme